jgi:plastocyanin
MRAETAKPMSVLVCVAAWFVMAAGTAWGGTIKGTVRFTGSVEQKKLPVTIDQYVCGKEKEAEDFVLSPDRGMRNAVVSLQTVPSGVKWEVSLSPAVHVDQKQCAFVPRVVIVPVGGTVEFLNSDRLLHNLKSASKESSFNRAQPHARTISIVFKKPDIIREDCDLHSWMRAWVVVADHPFYVVTNDRGEFVLDNVPSGKYTLQVWQESLGTVTREVTVGDKGSVTTVNMEMSKK